MKKIIDVHEKPPFRYSFFLSLQHLCAMFGASVLIPTLFKIDPSIVLLMNGFGTILYLVICRGRIPAFLGSSFAFIAPVLAILSRSDSRQLHHDVLYSYALGGFIIVGLVFCIIAIIVKRFGTRWIDVLIPPAAMGPIVALIGLELAPVAAEMAGFITAPGEAVNLTSITVSLFTLSIIILGTLFFRGFLSVIPILIGVICGYILSSFLGLTNISNVTSYPLFKLPNFSFPLFDLESILIILPASLVVISEHIGHLFVTSNIVGKDLVEKPGLHLSLVGNGLGTMLSGFVGSVPTTTYGENIGIMAITKVYSVWVVGGAGLLSMILAFSGTLAGIIQSIPLPVMGGVCLLLFGVIAASGIRMMVESKIDYNSPLNLIMTGLILIFGMSGISIQIGQVALKGMGLATILAISLNIFFYLLKKIGFQIKK